jgi:hypothetical protein
MQSFTVTSEMAGYGRKQMPKRILVIVVSLVAAEILTLHWWNGHSAEQVKLSSFAEAVICDIVFALLIEFWEVARNFPYTLVVSDDWIRVVYPDRETSFRKDEIKFARETEGNAFRVAGLEISKYGKFGAWLRGCVLIPKALPEYEFLRHLVFSWRHNTSI